MPRAQESAAVGEGMTAGLQDKVEKLLRKMGESNKKRRDNKNIWD